MFFFFVAVLVMSMKHGIGRVFENWFGWQVWPFTDWTMSSFYSPEGIQVEAPVFNTLPRLPTPLGSFLYTSSYFRWLLYPETSACFSGLDLMIESFVVAMWLCDEDWEGGVFGGRNLSVVDRLTALPLFQALLEFDAVWLITRRLCFLPH